MDNQIYEIALEQSSRVGKLLGVIGALIKYDNSDLPNNYFKPLAKSYLEVSTCENDGEAVMQQANKRGVTLSEPYLTNNNHPVLWWAGAG